MPSPNPVCQLMAQFHLVLRICLWIQKVKEEMGVGKSAESSVGIRSYDETYEPGLQGQPIML